MGLLSGFIGGFAKGAAIEAEHQQSLHEKELERQAGIEKEKRIEEALNRRDDRQELKQIDKEQRDVVRADQEWEKNNKGERPQIALANAMATKDAELQWTDKNLTSLTKQTHALANAKETDSEMNKNNSNADYYKNYKTESLDNKQSNEASKTQLSNLEKQYKLIDDAYQEEQKNLTNMESSEQGAYTPSQIMNQRRIVENAKKDRDGSRVRLNYALESLGSSATTQALNVLEQSKQGKTPEEISAIDASIQVLLKNSGSPVKQQSISNKAQNIPQGPDFAGIRPKVSPKQMKEYANTLPPDQREAFENLPVADKAEVMNGYLGIK